MSIFVKGPVKLHSVFMSDFKIDCDALTDEDIQTVAYLLSRRCPSFGEVHGIPRGGLRLAEAMKMYVSEGPPLIVDDVYTTGRSFKEFMWDFQLQKVRGAVIFARNACPSWITPLFSMTKESTDA